MYRQRNATHHLQLSEMLHKYVWLKSHYRLWSENQLHIWVVKQLNMCSWVFTPLYIPELPIYFAFYDLKERLGSCRESNSDKYTLLKLHCLISHQSNLKINLMFDREPVYSLQDTSDMLRPLSERKILTMPFSPSWSICNIFS